MYVQKYLCSLSYLTEQEVSIQVPVGYVPIAVVETWGGIGVLLNGRKSESITDMKFMVVQQSTDSAFEVPDGVLVGALSLDMPIPPTSYLWSNVGSGTQPYFDFKLLEDWMKFVWELAKMLHPQNKNPRTFLVFWLPNT